ncbi:MAG: hypothetical protein ACM33T_01305 [Solirubrobacterales bacterium]
METRSLGLILIWVGTIALVAVLQHRIRKGAWSEMAFDHVPPIERWSVAIAAGGLALAALGGALTLWSFR